MADPFIVLLLLALGEGENATSPALTAAARRALGSDAVVLVDERSTLPSDAAALALGGEVHAAGVAEVGWIDDAGLTARVHVHLPSGEWIDRELTFARADSATERGRALGFALATMVIERVAPQALGAAASPASASPTSPTSPTPPAPAPARPPSAATGATPAPSTPAKSPDARSSPAERRHAAIDLRASGTAGVGGEAATIGPAIAARALVAPALALRVEVAARFGELPAASAAVDELAGAVGAAVVLASWGALVLSARSDLAVMRLAARRSGVERSRWLGGADALLEGELRLGRTDAAIVAGAGAEVVFGPTAVDVGAARATLVPVARLLGEAGGRWRF